MELSRDKIKEIINDDWLVMDDCEGNKNCDVVKELACIALAAMDAEPVPYMTYKGYLLHADDPKLAEYSEPTPLYVTPPAPVVTDEMPCGGAENEYQDGYQDGWNTCRSTMLNHSENERDMDEPVSQSYKLPEEKGASLQLRNRIRKRHAEWSDATFGNVGPIGPLKHLSKEALEAAAEPDDLSEWADMQFLLWDAQRRAGISDGEITAAMEEKLKVNMARQWPEPKDGEPRMHIKEPGNSPVIPEGWQLVPKRLSAENGAKGALSGEFSETKFINCPECFGDEDCETCDGSGRIEISVPVTWTTIKAIWAKGVEHFSEAPKQEE